MKVALVSEGTYPFAMGGVSVWCDQLIRGLPDYRWEVVALTVDGNERPVFEAPDNLDGIYSIPLWGPRPDRRSPQRRSGGSAGGPQLSLPAGAAPVALAQQRGRSFLPAQRGSRPVRLRRPGRGLLPGRLLPGQRDRAGADFAAVHEAFLTALVTPPRPGGSDAAAVIRSRFLLALRGMYEYSADGGDLTSALMSNQALATMLEIWRDLRVEDSGPSPTLADALDAAWLIEHMLRPLTATPVAADIVHSSMNGLSMLVGFAAKWRYGTPLVMSEHGIYLRERYISFLAEDASHAVKVLVLSFFRSLAGAAYLLSDALTPHSSYNRRWQLHNGADPERMWTMYNGVEPAEFPPTEAEPAEPTISFMGRIDPLKDIHTLVRAFALVHERMPAARLRIFGGTPAVNRGYHESCQALIDELGLTAVARLEGRVFHPMEAYHAGSIVALTSISEGFPYTVIEAMSCGRSVVATNVGGVAEAVADTGIVVPPRDVPAIAEACLRLLRDDQLRRRLGAAARQRVLDRFTLQQSIEAYRNVYETVAMPERDSPQPRHLRTAARGRASAPAPAVSRVAAPVPAVGRAVVPGPAQHSGRNILAIGAGT